VCLVRPTVRRRQDNIDDFDRKVDQPVGVVGAIAADRRRAQAGRGCRGEAAFAVFDGEQALRFDAERRAAIV